MINLKRWVALALSLCLLMTGFALAEGIEITNEAVEEVESTNVDAATDEVVFELTGPDEGAVEIEPLQEDGLDRNDDSAATVSAVESTYGVDLQSDYYVSSVNPFYKKGYKGECTWYCWGRAYEKCGVKLSWSNDGTFGNAKYWYSNAKAWAENHEASYTTGTEPRENSIAVSTSGTYGHVVFIEEIANGKVYYSECNYTGPGVYNEGVKALNALPYVGYIYLGIPVTAAYFPDAGFRSYVSKHFDTDKNGWLSDAERDAVDHIYMNGEKGISDLAGIKCFKNLYELYCADCGLTSLDVSGCRELTILLCSGNKLKTLDISGTSIWKLWCYDNRLKKLVLNELCEDLYCYGNKLSELDISKSEELVGLRECVEEMEDGKSSRKVSSKGVIRYDSEHTMATLAFDAYTRLIIDGKKVFDVADGFLHSVWAAYYASLNVAINTGSRDPVSCYGRPGTEAARPCYFRMEDHALLVNPEKWKDDAGYANGVFIGQVTFGTDGADPAGAAAPRRIFPLAVWFDTAFGNE